MYIDLKDRGDYGFRGRPRCPEMYIDLKDRGDYGFSEGGSGGLKFDIHLLNYGFSADRSLR
jgi:hypothetical protein